MRYVVLVLPEPDGPTSATSWPGWASKSIPSSAKPGMMAIGEATLPGSPASASERPSSAGGVNAGASAGSASSGGSGGTAVP